MEPLTSRKYEQGTTISSSIFGNSKIQINLLFYVFTIPLSYTFYSQNKFKVTISSISKWIEFSFNNSFIESIDYHLTILIHISIHSSYHIVFHIYFSCFYINYPQIKQFQYLQRIQFQKYTIIHLNMKMLNSSLLLES